MGTGRNRIFEKKKFGEVFTPTQLVEETLNLLPVETWNNPAIKILDPANGLGAFPILVIKRFMKGLKNFEPNAEKRYKYILENIIYVCELQVKNMQAYIKQLNSSDFYKLNTYIGDFLNPSFNVYSSTHWKVDKFDIILGNPPYNQNIDLKFVTKSFDMADKILFVQPATWLIDEKNIQKKFSASKNLIKENLEKVILFNGNKIFEIQLFVPCAITYINKLYNGKIQVIDKINKLKISYSNINDINKYSTNEFISLKDKIKFHAQKDNVWNHLGDKGKAFVNISAIRGHVSTNNDNHLAKNDFYTTVTRNEEVSLKKDKYLYFGFPNGMEAQSFLKYNKTKFFRFCLSIYKNNGNLHRGELLIVPWLDFKLKWDDKVLYKHFELTADEIVFVEKVIPEYY